ncbi:TPA: hypothetical protein ACH3X1_013622 [Trebouxia sp. C0004]
MQFQSPRVEPLTGWNAAPLKPINDLASLWDTPPELWNLAANPDLPVQGQTTDPLAVQLGSVGSGTANFLDDLPAVVQPKRANSKEDRKLAVSREAQKRFRQRQKAKQRNIETELSETKTELEQIKLRQQELEARNRLLEKVAELSKATSKDDVQPSMQTNCFKHTFLNGQKTAEGPQLAVSVQGQDQTLTVATVSQMSPADFSSLWRAYIQKLGTCLLEVEEHQTVEAEQALTKLSMEAAALVCCLVHFNADTVKALYGLRLDNSQPVPHQPGDAFYSQLVDAAQLSEDQIRDLIHLWRMCSTRRGQLANARKTKLTQIPVECFSDVQMPDPRENVANLTEMANFIKENGTEDFKVYSDTMCAIYRGVLTIKQFAQIHVHSYPYLIQIDHMLEALARQRCQPSQQQILASAHTVDTKPHWTLLRAYHVELMANDDHINVHIPFLKGVASQTSSGSEGSTVMTEEPGKIAAQI